MGLDGHMDDKYYRYATMADQDYHRFESDLSSDFDSMYHDTEALIHEPDWSEKWVHRDYQA